MGHCRHDGGGDAEFRRLYGLGDFQALGYTCFASASKLRSVLMGYVCRIGSSRRFPLFVTFGRLTCGLTSPKSPCHTRRFLFIRHGESPAHSYRDRTLQEVTTDPELAADA